MLTVYGVEITILAPPTRPRAHSLRHSLAETYSYVNCAVRHANASPALLHTNAPERVQCWCAITGHRSRQGITGHRSRRDRVGAVREPPLPGRQPLTLIRGAGVI